MRLPSNILAKLYLTGLAITAACEPAHRESCETKPIVVDEDVPLDETIRGTTHDEMPAVAPRYPQPTQTQPQPSQPRPAPVVKKPPKRVWANVCGHMELVPENSGMVKCGMG